MIEEDSRTGASKGWNFRAQISNNENLIVKKNSGTQIGSW
jgi:hypothetical protein